jgi:hypothetical protein
MLSWNAMIYEIGIKDRYGHANLLSSALYAGEEGKRWKHALEFAPNACPVLHANAEAPCHFPNPNLASQPSLL